MFGFSCFSVKTNINVVNFKYNYIEGSKFFRCIKILSQFHPFLSFLLNLFLPCKDTFMDDYDGI